MSETAAPTQERPAVTLKPVYNMHHTAFRCRDAEQTRWFYEDVLGFKLAAAMVFDEEPGRSVKREYMHLFFQTADGNFIAFFDVPDDVEEKMFIARHGFDQHIAFEVESMEQLKAWRRHINKMGRPCFGPIDHGFIQSIYMYDPNGVQVELTVKEPRYDEILAEDSAKAHAVLKDWTARTRAIKEQRLSQEMLDQRGIDMSKIDTSKMKKILNRFLGEDMSTAKYEYDRIPYMIVFQEKSNFKDTYAGRMDFVGLEAHLLKPKNVDSKTVVIFMHPIGGGSYLPMVSSLAKKGYHVIYCNSRYRGVDSALIMEKVALDLGACIRDAKERLGYEKVVLAGWSGGGSLSLFYQSQAEHPTITETPAGDPIDLVGAKLIPADGMMLLAAHISRAGTLTEWMDASILDEADPTQRDRELDIYDSNNPNQPPYSAAFVEKYRAAQIARNRKITKWVKEKLAAFKRDGLDNEEFAFVVHGTMADPRFVDPTLDPNDRKPNWCYLGDPRVVNNGPVGLARFCTLRGWLSQWSYDDSNADGLKCAAQISVPTLVIGNTADDACTPSHTHRLFEAVGHSDKEMHEIKGANHYYFGQPKEMEQAVSCCAEWLAKKGF